MPQWRLAGRTDQREAVDDEFTARLGRRFIALGRRPPTQSAPRPRRRRRHVAIIVVVQR